MDLQNLTTFIEVAEKGSFTRAAENLGYSQPAVSAQIRQLELELDTKLFDRINHTVQLTDQGKKALEMAYDICHRTENMINQMRHVPELQGTVRVGMSDSMCSWLLEEKYQIMRREQPGITLEIVTTSTEGMLHLLDQNEVDLACTVDRHVGSKDYLIGSQIKEETHFVTAAGDPLASGAPLSPAQIVAQPCILTERGMSYRTLLEQQMAQFSLMVDPVLEVGSTDLICRLVERGMGISFLPDYVTERAVREGRLARLEVAGISIQVWRQIIYHRSKYLSPLLKTAIRYLS